MNLLTINEITTAGLTSSMTECLKLWGKESSPPEQVESSQPASNGAGKQPPPSIPCYAEGDDESAWERITRLIDALASAVMRDDDPGPTGATVLAKLRQTLDFRCDLLFGRFRMPAVSGSRDPVNEAVLHDLWQGADPA